MSIERIKSFKFIDGVQVSGTNVYPSQLLNIEGLNSFALEVSVVGGMSGSIAVEASISSGTWVPLSGLGLNDVVSGSNAYLINVTDLNTRYARLKYSGVAATSATGTLNAWMSGKAGG